MWFGTSDGLNRYDGYEFKIYKYNAKDSSGINSNNINIIFEDKSEQLWIGTQEGLNRYNRELDIFQASDLVSNYVDCFYEFPNGNILIGTGGGLFLINTEENNTQQIYNDIYVEDILMDNRNNLWLATSHGLRLADTTDYSYREFSTNKHNGVADEWLHCLYEDKQGRIWIGSANDGISILSYTGTFPNEIKIEVHCYETNTPESISHGAVLDIAEDPEGNIWIGIENGGLNLVRREDINKKISFIRYVQILGDETSLSSNSVHTIYADRKQTMWLGTSGGGISYYNKSLYKFKHIKQVPGNTNSMNNNNVNTILEDNGIIWLGTEGGLTRYDRQKNEFRHFTNDPEIPGSISSNAIWTLHRDTYGNLWVGTWAGGLNLFDKKKQVFKYYYQDVNDLTSIGANSIYDIISDSEGELWLATMGGGVNKFCYQTDNFERFVVKFNRNSISGNWVCKVLESSYDEIWISNTQAVDVYNKQTGEFNTFIHDPENSSTIGYNGAIDIYEDSKENIWLGTNVGLDLFQRSDSTFRHFTVSDGLPNNTVKAIIEDERENLWLSTNMGISKFENAINLPEKAVFHNYDVSDGLQGNEFNSRSVAKTSDGLIIFGGVNGFNIFHPDSIIDDPNLPEICFTNLYIFNKEVKTEQKDSPLDKHISMTSEIALPYKYSVFSISYVALNILAADKNQYAFKLEGFEENWNYVGTQRMATYTNLNPGKYTFRVIASNNDGLWNKEGASIDIVILPPWWKTLFARMVFVFIIGLVLYFFWRIIINSLNLKNRLKIEQMEKQKASELLALKLQFFTNISHELRTPLTLINAPLNSLLKSCSRCEELKKIKRNFLRLRTLVDQILDFRAIESNTLRVNLKTYDVMNLLKSLVENFADLAEQQKLSIHYHSNYSKLSMQVDKDKFEKIITNLLINAIQYTPAGGKILITAEDDINHNGHLKISVADSGKGIPKEDLARIFDRFYTHDAQNEVGGGTGIGLHLTKHYVELIGGNIQVSSKEGEGSVFSVSIPYRLKELHFGNEDHIITDLKMHSDEMPIVPEFPEDENDRERKILVIDDNVEMCRYIHDLLKQEYQVVTLEDSRKGFKVAINTMPDLIVSDIMMPYLNGNELCRQLKSDSQTSHIPIILLTAKAALTDKLEGLQNGADAYISKPFEEELLLSYVHNLIEQRDKLRKSFSANSFDDPIREVKNSYDQQFLKKIYKIIKENYSQADFGVNQIIEKMGMSRTVFYNKYKSLSDLSINDTIKLYRLKQAQNLLLEQRLSINEIAIHCGFNDASYFGKVFKGTYRVTPREFINTKLKKETV